MAKKGSKRSKISLPEELTALYGDYDTNFRLYAASAWVGSAADAETPLTDLSASGRAEGSRIQGAMLAACLARHAEDADAGESPLADDFPAFMSKKLEELSAEGMITLAAGGEAGFFLRAAAAAHAAQLRADEMQSQEEDGEDESEADTDILEEEEVAGLEELEDEEDEPAPAPKPKKTKSRLARERKDLQLARRVNALANAKKTRNRNNKMKRTISRVLRCKKCDYWTHHQRAIREL